MSERAATKASAPELLQALRTLSRDMHNTSMRPCPTCDPITKLLGEPFGCRAYEADVVRARKNGSEAL